MNKTEESCDVKTESCCSASPQFKQDEEDAPQNELQPIRGPVAQGKMTACHSPSVAFQSSLTGKSTQFVRPGKFMKVSYNDSLSDKSI